MSQIFGCIHPERASTIARLVEAMRSAQQRSSQSAATNCWSDESIGIGFGSLASGEQGGMGLIDPSKPSAGIWLLDGEIYRVSEPAKRLLSEKGRSEETPEALAASIPLLYHQFGVELPGHLDGSFCIAIYDASKEALIIANDRFSTRTMYWLFDRGSFAFATEMKGLLPLPFVSRKPNRNAFRVCLAFDWVWDEQTFMDGVFRLPPASILEYRLDGEKDLRRYWSPETAVRHHEPLTPERLEAIVHAFYDSVYVRTKSKSVVGASLSGGLDSRVIAAVASRNGRQLLTCTEGMEGCSDQHLSQQIADITSAKHVFYPLEMNRLEKYIEALKVFVFETDGMALIGGFPGTAVLTKDFCRKAGVQILLRGHGGEHTHLESAWPFYVNSKITTIRDRAGVLSHLLKSLWHVPQQIDLSRLITDQEMRPSASTAEIALREMLEGVADDLSPSETMDLLYLRQMDGNTVAMYRNLLRGQVEMGLPYLDYVYMDLVLSTSIDRRCHPEIHYEIIERTCPALMGVANSNTGAPLNASSLRLALTDKLHSLLRRIKIPGFRQYHYMTNWVSTFLAPQVRELILNERTLSRGFYERKAIEELVDMSRRDSLVSSFLIRLAHMETWCRLFLDGDAQSNHK